MDSYRGDCRARRIFVHSLIALGCLLLATEASAQSQPAARPTGAKYAILVAPAYDGNELHPLDRARDDLMRLKTALQESGYAQQQVLLLASGAGRRFLPEGIKLRQELKRQLDNLEPSDTVVLAIIGHAVRFKGDKPVYFCPQDARLAD